MSEREELHARLMFITGQLRTIDHLRSWLDEEVMDLMALRDRVTADLAALDRGAHPMRRNFSERRPPE